MVNVRLLGQNSDLTIVYFKLNGIEYGVEHDGSLLDFDGIRFTDNAPFEIDVNQDWDNETTEYNFRDLNFKILNTAGNISLVLEISGDDIKKARSLLGLTQTEFAMII